MIHSQHKAHSSPVYHYLGLRGSAAPSFLTERRPRQALAPLEHPECRRCVRRSHIQGLTASDELHGSYLHTGHFELGACEAEEGERIELPGDCMRANIRTGRKRRPGTGASVLLLNKSGVHRRWSKGRRPSAGGACPEAESNLGATQDKERWL